MSSSRKPQLLDIYQSAAETDLLAAWFVATSDLLVLQAFLLYLVLHPFLFMPLHLLIRTKLALRNRARPATLFSLMSIAVRIAQRMGYAEMVPCSVCRLFKQKKED
jgi:hypothetical protein